MKQIVQLCAVIIITALVLPSALAAGSVDGPQLGSPRDDRVDPLTQTQRALRAKGLSAKLNGKVQKSKKVHQVANGQYVELAREGEDPVWTVLGEFADLPRGTIPEPDRATNNITIWDPAFDRDYYMNMLFSDNGTSMRDYYIKQSSNRYTVYGDVTDWVTVPGDAAGYDDDISGEAVWQFLIDSVNGWYQAQIQAGMTPAEIDQYLAQFDVWDRYDWDGDGIFNEPDGYIDHAQFVHAGEGNEAGGGDDAIWSHSWFAYFGLIGFAGPSPEYLVGGIQVGNSSFWINKYTIQPENGGVGVFAHEFGHDLGLPDLYDYYGDNATGFWTAMSSGSWLGTDQDLGSKPGHFGAWEKFQLGWLNYEVAFASKKSEHKLGPAETNTKQAQGLFVVLPPKEVVVEIGAPFSGSYVYYSGSGDNLNNWMFKAYTLEPATQLTAMVDYRIELNWDYAYLVVSTDGGASWQTVETNHSTDYDPNSQNFGHGITGFSPGWQTLTADLSAYTGEVLVGFMYWTDGSAVNRGLMVDNIQVGARPVEGAEVPEGWTLAGFKTSTGIESAFYDNYYLAEFRQYRDYDEGLANAYNYLGGDWVEHFPYQDGLLISYWDTSFPNNNVTFNCDHGRCGGMLLPIDAHADLLVRSDGYLWRNRVQTFDATFGLEPTDPITLHVSEVPNLLPSLPAVSTFDDRVSHYRPENPTGSVNHPNTGTQVRIKSVSARGSFMQVEVRPAH